MKKRFIWFWILLGCLLTQQGLVSADEVKNIHVVCDEWLGYTNRNGTGVYWEIVKAVYEPIGIHVKTEVMPWKRADLSVLQHVADALVGEYYFPDTAGREFLYPKWHISIEEQIVVLFRKGTLTEWESKGVKTLTGKTVGWIRGYEFDKKDWLDVQINVHELRILSQGIRMFAARRIDALIDYRSTIVEEGEKAGIPVKDEYDIKPVGRIGQKLFLKFANTKRSETFIKIFDERMTQLAKSGEIEKLYKKWGLSESKFGIDRYGK